MHVNELLAWQVRNFYVGKDHVGDVPLTKKILAALTTGEYSGGCLCLQV